MKTRDKLAEARDILAAMLVGKRDARLVRAHSLIESALSDFFDSLNDEAALTDEDDVWIATEEPPQPTD
jgi:hypothetical protein